MPDFEIISRRGGTPWWYAYNTNDIFVPAWDTRGGSGGRQRFNPPDWPGFAYDKHGIERNKQMTMPCEWANMQFFLWGDGTFGPYFFPAEVPLVITEQGGDPDHIFLNLEATLKQVDNELQGKIEPPKKVMGSGPNASEMVADVASALLGGLATALAATAPELALAGGGVAVMGGLTGSLGASYPSTEMPEYPSLQEIESAVSDVVSLNDARIAGSYFQSIYLWFTRKARDIDSFHEDNRPIPAKLQSDFLTAVDEALRPDSTGSFYSSLMYVSRNPKVARYILSELLVAIGLYVHLTRINLGQTYIPYALQQKSKDKVIPPSDISDLVQDVTNLRDGFDKARKAFNEMRAEIVRRYGFEGIPEAIFIIKKVSEFYIGEPYAAKDDDYAKGFPNGCQVDHDGKTEWTWGEKGYQTQADTISDTYGALQNVVAALADDLAKVKQGKWPQKLLNVDWSTLAS
jgi:hypothetical protein